MERNFKQLEKENAELKQQLQGLTPEIKNILDVLNQYHSDGDISTWVYSDLFDRIDKLAFFNDAEVGNE